MELPLKIFILYAHEDLASKDALIKALRPLQIQGIVDTWHDGNIFPGQVWGDQIRKNLDEADLILPLVSNDFFGSEQIQKIEIQQVFERFENGDCLVVPIIIRASAWQADNRLSRLKVLPRDGKPINSWGNLDEAYNSVISGIIEIIADNHLDHPNLKTIAEPQVETGHLATTSVTSLKKRNHFLTITLTIGLFVASVIGYFYQKRVDQIALENLEKISFERTIEAATIPALNKFRYQFPNSEHIPIILHAISSFEDSINYYSTSARALRKGGLVVQAKNDAARALRINPDDPELISLAKDLGLK